MIIDCHEHYTTAPKASETWRARQIAGLKDRSAAPKASELRISDAELQESIESNQLKLMRERGSDLMIFSPRASFMAHHIGEAVAARYGIEHVSTALAQSLARSDVDAVILCTPTQLCLYRDRKA